MQCTRDHCDLAKGSQHYCHGTRPSATGIPVPPPDDDSGEARCATRNVIGDTSHIAGLGMHHPRIGILCAER